MGVDGLKGCLGLALVGYSIVRQRSIEGPPICTALL